jgi:hypothetical protein
LIETRKTAAENSGDQAAAAAYSAQLMELDQDPNGLLLTALMPLAATMEPGEFDTFYGIAVGEGEEPPAAQSQIAKLQADLDAGLINQDQYDLEVAKMAPSGMVIESTPDGGFRMVQGAGAASDPRFTEGQGKDNVFSTRARGALETFEPVADLLTQRSDLVLGAVPLGLGRDFQDPQYQVARQSGDEFLQAILRKDTGAAITEPEQRLYGMTYIPQPGDSAPVLEAKREARIRAVNALESGMNAEQMAARDRALVNAAREAGGEGAASEAVAPSDATPPARTRLRYNPETGTFD